MSHQSCKDRFSHRRDERVAMDHGQRRWAVGAFLDWSLEQRSMLGKRSPLSGAHHAVMLSTSSAAGRQVRLTLRGQRKERRDQRQAEHGNQKNGEKSTQ